MHPVATFLPYEHIYLILTTTTVCPPNSKDGDWNEASSMENKKSHHDNKIYIFNQAEIKQIILFYFCGSLWPKGVATVTIVWQNFMCEIQLFQQKSIRFRILHDFQAQILQRV